MNYHFTIKQLLLIWIIFSFNKFKSQTIGSKAPEDTISIFIVPHEYNSDYKIRKSGNIFTLSDGFNLNKKLILTLIEDFPELKKHVEKNYLNTLGFAYQLTNCYNDYLLSNDKAIPNYVYFKKFGLITNRDRRVGPKSEDIHNKEKITTSSSVIGNPNSMYIENFRAYFRHGNSGYYKLGFLLKNLNKIIKHDPKASKYIIRYKRIVALKLGLLYTGLGTFGAGLMMHELNKKNAQEMSLTMDKKKEALYQKNFNRANTLLGIGGWVTIGGLYPLKGMKFKNINRAIEIYNSNLDEEIKLGR